MENVAKSLDAPIKVGLLTCNGRTYSRTIGLGAAGHLRLVCRVHNAGSGRYVSPPQPFTATAESCHSVLPGVFLSLALRYDYANHVQRRLQADPKSTPTKRDRYVKPYFIAVLVAYVLGLVTTVVVMHRFKAAQPALLYLSPACSQYQGFPSKQC